MESQCEAEKATKRSDGGRWLPVAGGGCECHLAQKRMVERADEIFVLTASTATGRGDMHANCSKQGAQELALPSLPHSTGRDHAMARAALARKVPKLGARPRPAGELSLGAARSFRGMGGRFPFLPSPGAWVIVSLQFLIDALGRPVADGETLDANHLHPFEVCWRLLSAAKKSERRCRILKSCIFKSWDENESVTYAEGSIALN